MTTKNGQLIAETFEDLAGLTGAEIEAALAADPVFPADMRVVVLYDRRGVPVAIYGTTTGRLADAREIATG